MSKETIMSSSSHDVPAITVKPGKTALISAESVTSWLDEAASGRSFLSSIIYAYTGEQRRGVVLFERAAPADGSKVSAAVLLLIIVPFFFLFNWFVHTFFPAASEQSSGQRVVLMCIAFGFPLVFSFTAWIPFFAARRKKFAALWKSVRKVQAEGVQLWLEARYGLQVDELTRQILSDGMLLDASVIPFVSVDSVEWVLQRDDSTCKYQAQAKQVEAEVVV